MRKQEFQPLERAASSYQEKQTIELSSSEKAELHIVSALTMVEQILQLCKADIGISYSSALQ